jgi:glycosyltransferase involved in cell wall biosynthesis
MKMKIARIATVPFFLYNHLREQIAATVAAGHEVVLISSGGEEAEWLRRIPGVRFQEIDIPRKISPLRDLRALWRLFLFFRRERFDIVHSTTPKAGMLCAIAGFFARAPIRLHTFTGQAWVEMRGMARFVAKAGDWLTAHLNTLSYADSFSQRDFIIAEGVCAGKKIRVPGAGSLAGVDISRFNPAKWAGSKESTLKELDIPPGSRVITFIGRLTRDKGLGELMEAFARVAQEAGPCVLVLVGPEDKADGTLSSRAAASEGNIRYVGYSDQPERYLAVTDIFCLPSYREGFGNVIIEAAAMGVPAIGSDIVGLRDSIANGETGVLVPAKDSPALATAMLALLADDKRRIEMGECARARAVALFDARVVSAAVLNEYSRLQGGAR